METRYTFNNNIDLDERTLLCPKCEESLYRADIEYFNTCPYCSSPLDMTNELEDFLLEPIVDIWTFNEQQRML
ncbi:MAG: hypothetical protein GXP32_08790 [Kiritimatiellaeota bacterium]|nr:hypothetical protein [Kiritimatiellota bacterium]